MKSIEVVEQSALYSSNILLLFFSSFFFLKNDRLDLKQIETQISKKRKKQVKDSWISDYKSMTNIKI